MKISGYLSDFLARSGSLNLYPLFLLNGENLSDKDGKERNKLSGPQNLTYGLLWNVGFSFQEDSDRAEKRSQPKQLHILYSLHTSTCVTQLWNMMP